MNSFYLKSFFIIMVALYPLPGSLLNRFHVNPNVIWKVVAPFNLIQFARVGFNLFNQYFVCFINSTLQFWITCFDWMSSCLFPLLDIPPNHERPHILCSKLIHPCLEGWLLFLFTIYLNLATLNQKHMLFHYYCISISFSLTSSTFEIYCILSSNYYKYLFFLINSIHHS